MSLARNFMLKCGGKLSSAFTQYKNLPLSKIYENIISPDVWQAIKKNKKKTFPGYDGIT